MSNNNTNNNIFLLSQIISMIIVKEKDVGRGPLPLLNKLNSV
jgi:hypothetical protein